MGAPCCKQKKSKKTEEPKINTEIPAPMKVSIPGDESDNRKELLIEHSNGQIKKSPQLSFEQRETNLSKWKKFISWVECL
jgi:hypothetical protein